MLIWLDGNTNRKVAPNENYGRELLELFTLGVGNYTEDDVQASARAFTGWNLRKRSTAQFFFNKNQHDYGQKTFLGTTGPLDGGDILDASSGNRPRPSGSARKLFAFFAYPNPEPTCSSRWSAPTWTRSTTSARWSGRSSRRTRSTPTVRGTGTSSHRSSTASGRFGCSAPGSRARPDRGAALDGPGHPEPAERGRLAGRPAPGSTPRRCWSDSTSRAGSPPARGEPNDGGADRAVQAAGRRRAS